MALKVYEGYFYTIYVDKGTIFEKGQILKEKFFEKFWAFNILFNCSHESIHIKWVENLNSSKKQKLAFFIGNE